MLVFNNIVNTDIMMHFVELWVMTMDVTWQSDDEAIDDDGDDDDDDDDENVAAS